MTTTPVAEATETVPITNERGQTKLYETVPSRLRRFRLTNPVWTIQSEVLECNDDVVRVQVTIGFQIDGGGFNIVARAHAEEYRTDNGINATSALENCETSALGRALSFAGFGSPDTIASAEEVIGAKAKEEDIASHQPGAVVLLQEAAKKGPEELQRVWEDVLSKSDRVACRTFLPKLKRDAEKALRKDDEQTE